METLICAFPGCDNPQSKKAAKGLCSSHYWQAHKGRPLTPLSYRRNRCVPWLEAHVGDPDGSCLIWPFHRLQNDGRATVKFKGKQTLAARVMCEMVNGPPPTERHEAAHSCGKGTSGCVHPKHLRWASHAENEADKIAHGTKAMGERQGMSKLTDAKVLAIRALLGTVSQAKIAKQFGVTQTAISKIARGVTWRHI